MKGNGLDRCSSCPTAGVEAHEYVEEGVVASNSPNVDASPLGCPEVEVGGKGRVHPNSQSCYLNTDVVYLHWARVPNNPAEVEALLRWYGEAVPYPNYHGCYSFQLEDKLLLHVAEGAGEMDGKKCMVSSFGNCSIGKGLAMRILLMTHSPQLAGIPDRDCGLEQVQLF
jgi:hypothetical protein